MKIEVEKNNIKLILKTESNISKEKANEVVGIFCNIIDSFGTSTNDNIKPVLDYTKKQEQIMEKPKIIERPMVRNRLPNNAVDIADLTIKQAIKEKALVRCPKCGQSHCLAVSSGSRVYMMERQFSSNEFGIIAEFDSLGSQDFVNMCCKEDTDKQLYFKDLQALKPLDDKDFAVNNDTEIFCPVCHESNTFETWKDAFENPLNYFETEHLCDACGGEKLEKLIKKKKVYACDSCGLISDFKEED